MKKTYWIFVMMVLLLSTSCIVQFDRRMRVEYDRVRESKTITKELSLNKILEWNTGFGSTQQTLQKIIKKTGEIEYWVYEQLIISTSMHPLDPTIYLLIDENIVPIELRSQESETFTKISEDTKSVPTSDSTQVTVVSGYSQSDYRSIRIQYTLDEEVIKLIQNADNLFIRYYFGPKMVTVGYRSGQTSEVIKWANTY